MGTMVIVEQVFKEEALMQPHLVMQMSADECKSALAGSQGRLKYNIWGGEEMHRIANSPWSLLKRQKDANPFPLGAIQHYETSQTGQGGLTEVRGQKDCGLEGPKGKSSW